MNFLQIFSKKECFFFASVVYYILADLCLIIKPFWEELCPVT